ncbi:hypothetical protein [Micromonospora sp. WMMD998]|uniref:hypothetical protein n=1 Tax=Micromonospora sp. WMMD998 TaxID=3016092 RepID=UPI00249A4E1E|nr:hypothetical protein [Micromonospora sp. WMMD998]
MSDEDLILKLARPGTTKILFFVIDGFGGFRSATRGSELALAVTPHLDALAEVSVLGLIDPVGRGVTAGSGAGHLALFGYDPVGEQVSRGAFTAAALDVQMRPGDVAARANICTLHPDGTIADRRAGRMSTAEATEVCAAVASIPPIDGVEFRLVPEMGHRALLLLRGDGLCPAIADTDPQHTGVPPLEPRALTDAAARTSAAIRQFLEHCARALADRRDGNYLLLRGFGGHRTMAQFGERFRMSAVSVTSHPFYRGISRLLGFDCRVADDLDHAIALLPSLYDHGSEFVYLHTGEVDLAGEDGNVDRKVQQIEEIDARIPALLASGADVIVITGDHATPTQLAAHSHHPVPVLLHGGHAGADGVRCFDEVSCRAGSLGRFPARALIGEVLAAAGRLDKYDCQALP